MNSNRVFLFVAIFLLLLTETGKAQSGSAQVYSGGSTYGSIGYNSTQNGIVLDFNRPISVAQNTPAGTAYPSSISTPPSAPATVSDFAPQPVLTNPPSAIGSAPIFQQVFDPYAMSNTLPVSAGSSISTIFTPKTTYNANTSSVSGIYSGNFDRFVPETYNAMRRFRDATRVDYTFLPGGKNDKSFGMSQFDIQMQLAIPCRYIPNNGSQGYFYIAPGANLLWWDGPIGPPDMSPNGFGAFLDFGMQPQFNEIFSLNAWFRFGVFSDFKKIKSDAIRYQGRLEGVFNVDPNIQLTAGIIYLDRERHKIMPTGGVIWTLRDDLVLKLVFPNPKISKRLWNSGNAEWWGYVQGDYGGGSWCIDGIGKTDYNDIKIGVGIEFETQSRIGGYFEFGGSFARELYSHGQKWADPSDVIYIKTGFLF